MNGTPIGTIESRKRIFTVCVDGYGLFHIELEDRKLTAETFAELKTKLAQEEISAPKRRVISIPVMKIGDAGIVQGEIVGIHAGNGNALIKWVGVPKSEQVGSYSRVMAYTAELSETLTRLHSEYRAAAKSFEHFCSLNRIDPIKAATAELAKETA